MTKAFMIDKTQAQALVARLWPDWSDLPLRDVPSSGTDNTLFRLGDQLALRVPKHKGAIGQIAKDAQILGLFGPLPLAVPRPHAIGLADDGIPCAITDWIEGQEAHTEALSDPIAAARVLGQFLNALRQQPAGDAPVAGDINSNRGVPLAQMDAKTRESIAVLSDEMDPIPALSMWEEALAAAKHVDPLVFLHGDLKADNMIVRDGALIAVIDWGLSALGDPAADLSVAWSWVQPEARDVFRQSIDLGGDLDAAAWVRGRGWALYGAVIALSYYRGGKNPALCATCRATLRSLGLVH